MKVKFILAMVAASVSFSSFSTYGQGTILFNNRVTGQVDAPISNWDGTPAGAYGPGVFAQLFLVTGGSTYTPLFPVTTFRQTPVAAQYYVVQPDTAVTVPGVPAGAQATIVLRAWGSGETYDTALYKGQSNPVTITLGGIPPGGGAPIQDAVLVGLQGFVGPIPEPSTVALGLLGAAVLLGQRRR
jgi:hypothetical protein